MCSRCLLLNDFSLSRLSTLNFKIHHTSRMQVMPLCVVLCICVRVVLKGGVCLSGEPAVIRPVGCVLLAAGDPSDERLILI